MMRIDKYITDQYKITRSQAQRLIRDGKVRMNGATIQKSSLQISEQDDIRIEADLPAIRPNAAEPDRSVQLDILYEDDQVIVINKPAGLVVHPGEKQYTGTVANGLIARYPEIKNVGEDVLRPGIVHRLDKGTSGVMIIAKTQEAYKHLRQQFHDRLTQKTYVALVHGQMDTEEGMIDEPIGRGKKQFQKMMVGQSTRHPREAVTAWKVLEHLYKDGNAYSYLELHPKTGRMHQLRVHLASIHHGIVGDPVYGQGIKGLATPPARILLHAGSLTVTLPNGTTQRFTAPTPRDFTEYIASISS